MWIKLLAHFLEIGTAVIGEKSLIFVLGKELPVLIRTGNNAITAADTFILVNRNYAIVPFISCARGTNFNTGSILALITANRIGRDNRHYAIDIRFYRYQSGPINAVRQEVLDSAGYNAAVTANAFGKVYYHSPSHRYNSSLK
jgi:hypothetical protein